MGENIGRGEHRVINSILVVIVNGDTAYGRIASFRVISQIIYWPCG